MNERTAWQAIQTAFRCGNELQRLLPTLKKNCTPDEYRQFARGVAAAMDAVNVQVLDRALTAHPALKARIEDQLTKTGRVS